jgi:hypothetical protein
VSWKFKPVGNWQFVMITSPADRTFIVDATQSDQLVRGLVEVRANAWDENGVLSAKCRIDDGSWRSMARIGNGPGWRCTWQSGEATDGVHEVTVEVQSSDGRTAADTISVEITNPAGMRRGPASLVTASMRLAPIPRRASSGRSTGRSSDQTRTAANGDGPQ